MVAISTTHMGINDRTLNSSNRRMVAVTVVAMTTVLDRVSNGCNKS